MNFPLEIQVVILSFLSFKTIEDCIINNSLPHNLIIHTLKYKFPQIDIKNIKGITSNYNNNCFKCYESLDMNYNIILCDYCNFKLENNKKNPIVCHSCSNSNNSEMNLERGVFKYSFCCICNNTALHLGITPFS